MDHKRIELLLTDCKSIVLTIITNSPGDNEGNQTLDLSVDSRLLCHSATLPCVGEKGIEPLRTGLWDQRAYQSTSPQCVQIKGVEPLCITTFALKANAYTIPPYLYMLKCISTNIVGDQGIEPYPYGPKPHAQPLSQTPWGEYRESNPNA